jgi:hypothetical protein
LLWLIENDTYQKLLIEERKLILDFIAIPKCMAAYLLRNVYKRSNQRKEEMGILRNLVSDKKDRFLI